jgi:hypothetical protein
MLPDVVCIDGIEDIYPAKQSPNSTRGSFEFVGTFCCELLGEFFETVWSFCQFLPFN